MTENSPVDQALTAPGSNVVPRKKHRGRAGNPFSRHGLRKAKVAINLYGFGAIDRRTAAARETLAFYDELVAALGGEAELTPQRKKVIDLAARASLYLDHLDGWLMRQRHLVNHRTRAAVPALVQRQVLAEHLARLLERLGLERKPKPVPDLGTVTK